MEKNITRIYSSINEISKNETQKANFDIQLNQISQNTKISYYMNFVFTNLALPLIIAYFGLFITLNLYEKRKFKREMKEEKARKLIKKAYRILERLR